MSDPTQALQSYISVLADLSPDVRRSLLHQDASGLRPQVQEGSSPGLHLSRQQKKRLSRIMSKIAASSATSPPLRHRFSATEDVLPETDQGVRLPWKSEARPTTRIRNDVSKWSPDRLAKLNHQILQDYCLGAIEPSDDIRCSSLVFATRSGSERKLHLCSAFFDVNDSLTKATCVYDYPSRFCRVPKSFRCGIKLDLRSAFKYVPIHVEDRPYLGLELPGLSLRYRSLPFGLSHAPQLFCAALARSLEAVRLSLTTQQDAMLVSYMDDLALAAVDIDALLRLLDKVIEALLDDGWYLALDKCFLLPTPALNFLGVVVHFISRKMYVLPSHVEKLTRRHRLIMDADAPIIARYKALESLVGLASFIGYSAAPEVLLARRPLYDLLPAYAAAVRDNQSVSSEVVSVTDVWVVATIECARESANKLHRTLDPDAVPDLRPGANIIQLITDASVAFCGVLFVHGGYLYPRQLPLPTYLQEAGSGIRELASLLMALQLLTDAVPEIATGARIFASMDAQVAVAMVSRWSSTSRVARDLLAQVRKLINAFNLELQLTWTDRESGFIPIVDSLSKLAHPKAAHWADPTSLKLDLRAEARLAPGCVDLLRRRFGTWDLDLYASATNATAPAYCSRVPPPEVRDRSIASGVRLPLTGWRGDGRAANVSGLFTYIFPPWSQLRAVYQSITSSVDARILLIIKMDPDLPEFPLICEMRSWAKEEVVLSDLYSYPIRSATGNPVHCPWPIVALRIDWRPMDLPHTREEDPDGLIGILLFRSKNDLLEPGPMETSRRCDPLREAMFALCPDSVGRNPPACFIQPTDASSRAGATKLMEWLVHDPTVTAPTLDMPTPCNIDSWLDAMSRFLVGVGSFPTPPGIAPVLIPVALRNERLRANARSASSNSNLIGTIRRLRELCLALQATQAPAVSPNIAVIAEAYIHQRLDSRLPNWRPCGAPRIAAELSSLRSFVIQHNFASPSTPLYFGQSVALTLKMRDAFTRRDHSIHWPIHLADIQHSLTVHPPTSEKEREMATALGVCACTGLRFGSTLALTPSMFTLLPHDLGVILAFNLQSKSQRGDVIAAAQSPSSDPGVVHYPFVVANGSPFMISLVKLWHATLHPDTRIFTSITREGTTKWCKTRFFPDRSVTKDWLVGVHGARVAFATEMDSLGLPDDVQCVLLWWKRSPSMPFYYRGVDVAAMLHYTQTLGSTRFTHFAPGRYSQDRTIRPCPFSIDAMAVPLLSILDEAIKARSAPSSVQVIPDIVYEDDEELDLSAFSARQGPPFNINETMFLDSPGEFRAVVYLVTIKHVVAEDVCIVFHRDSNTFNLTTSRRLRRPAPGPVDALPAPWVDYDDFEEPEFEHIMRWPKTPQETLVGSAFEDTRLTG